MNDASRSVTCLNKHKLDVPRIVQGSTLRLSPWDAITIPARTVHRTRAIGRTVNLTFEHLAADTVVVDPVRLSPRRRYRRRLAIIVTMRRVAMAAISIAINTTNNM